MTLDRRQREELDRHITGNYGEDSVAEEPDKYISVLTKVEVPRRIIADTLCNALEGGSNYWCERLQVNNFGVHEWAHEALAHDAPWTFKVFEEEEDQQPKLKLYAALHQMAEDFPTHFNDMVQENHDADTGDCLFQLLCFGEVVYG